MTTFLRPMTAAEQTAVRMHDNGDEIGEICVATRLRAAEVAAAIELRDQFGQLLTPPPTDTDEPSRTHAKSPGRPTHPSSPTRKERGMTAVLENPSAATDEPGACPTPDKQAFETRIEAMAAVAEDDQRHGTDNTPYRCDPGCKRWHNTTHAHSQAKTKPNSSSPRINAEAANWPAAPLRPTRELAVGFYVLHPKTAAYWLTNLNIHNRDKRDKGVSGYAIDMHTGGWDFNGDTFRFDTDGAMFDGQHRCEAIVLEGNPVPIILATGLDPVAQETTDTGMRRTFADALRLAGETDVNNLASITMAAFLWKTGQIRGLKTGVSVRVLQKVLRDHPELRDAVLVARRVHKHVPVKNSVLGLASWLFVNLSREDHDDFFDKLATGADLGKNSPIRLLRNRMLADAKSKEHLSRTEILALFIKAWNHYRAGNEVTYLKFTSGGKTPEAMPEPR